MKDYRVYKLNEADGKIIRAKDVQALEDSAALVQAAEDDDCPVCEVWQGTQKIGLIA